MTQQIYDFNNSLDNGNGLMNTGDSLFNKPLNNTLKSSTNFGDTSPITSGQKPGMSSAETNALSAGIGSAVDIGLSVYQGISQQKENDKNRKEARGLAEQTRQDTLKQNDINFSLKKKIAVNEEKAFTLQKKKDNYDLRFTRFISNLEKMILNQQNLDKQMSDLFSPDKATAIQQFMSQTQSGGK